MAILTKSKLTASKGALMALIFVPSLVLADQAGATDKATVIEQTKPIIMSFGKHLKTELKQAMMSGGPVKGIAACNVSAPKLTEQASASGWKVARTSLKWRNENNKPDAWEQKQLTEFDRKLAAGVSPKTLWAVHEDEKEIRVMKAITTQEVCLACHGQTLMPDVSKKLNELYVNDRATGYNVGEIRGAFSLTKFKL